jgi:hypothetical protein
MKHVIMKRNALILLVGGLIAVSCSLRVQVQNNYHEAIPALLLVVGAFMIIAGGAVHIRIISQLEKEIAELQRRNDTEPHESSKG